MVRYFRIDVDSFFDGKMMQNSWKAIQPIVQAGSRCLTTTDLHRQSKQPILVTQSSSLQKKINYYALEVGLLLLIFQF